MKKALLILAASLALQVSTAFAFPVVELMPQQSSISLSTHGGDRSNEFSLNTQLSPTFAVGFQHVDWTDYGNMNDFYGQFFIDEGGQTRLILGSRNYSSESKTFVGAALTTPLSEEWKGYAALIGGDGFHELSVGANYKITDTAYLNFDYRTLSDHGTKNGVGIGLTTTF
ncbi:MAG: hypothetical protein H6Q73_115 [Firmicutes bacterium]|nr:hypothetical protein [Bacillota bacterium]